MKEDFVMTLLEALKAAEGPRGGAEHEREGRKEAGSGVY